MFLLQQAETCFICKVEEIIKQLMYIDHKKPAKILAQQSPGPSPPPQPRHPGSTFLLELKIGAPLRRGLQNTTFDSAKRAVVDI